MTGDSTPPDPGSPAPWSRRSFVLAGASVILSARLSPGASRDVSAREVVDRIRGAVGVPWRETTVDTFKAGDPGSAITGIAVTAMATLDVLKRAAAAGRNLVITCEPAFYSPNDAADGRTEDPVYLAKKAFITDHRLVVWRFSDHWLARSPNEFTRALGETLGWTARRNAGSEAVFTIPATTLGSVATHVRTTLALRGGMRIVGTAGRTLRIVALSPGTTTTAAAIELLQHADLIVCGEPREWEAVEYVFDTAFAGGPPKSMIAVGRIVSEEPGMHACAAWLRALVPEVPVEPFAVGDPYWRPAP